MMQKISLNKSAFNVFGFTLKKNLGFSLVAAILSIMVSPVYIYSVIKDYLSSYSKLIYRFENMQILFSTLMAIAATLFLIILLFINFSFLFSKSASDYFHALPLKRWELLVARFMASFVSSLIPLTVGYIGTFAITLLSFVEANPFLCIKAYLFTVLMMLLLGLFTLIFIIISGGVFDSIIGFVAVNLGLPIIVAYISNLCAEHIYGFVGDLDFEAGILSYTTPFAYPLIKLLLGLTGEGAFFSIKSILGSIAQIIIWGGISVILYKNRKAEKLGGSYAFKFMPELIGLIVSAIGLFFFGYLFGESPANAIYWIMGSIGAIITAVVYSLIINRGFKKVKKAIAFGGLASLVLICVNLGIKYDITGYRYNLPKAEQIESVNIQSGVIDINVRNIDLALELNRSIVNEHSDDYLGNDRTNMFTFEYTLKDGRTVTRRYSVETKIAKEEKSRLIAEEYSRSLVEEFNEFKEKKADSWTLSGYLYDSYQYIGSFETHISEEKVEELVKAYATDIKSYGNNYFIDMADAGLSSVLISGNKVVNTYYEEDSFGGFKQHTDYEDYFISVDNYEKFETFSKVLSTIEYEIIPEGEKY